MVKELFLLSSLDGKISTGVGPYFDFDTDFMNDEYLKVGLNDYYEIEKTTYEWSIISGAIAEKLGANEGKYPAKYVDINQVVIDSSHLTTMGINSLKKKRKFVLIFTKNEYTMSLPEVQCGNVRCVKLRSDDTVKEVLDFIENEYNPEGVTIQTGGTLNRLWAKSGMLDKVSIVLAPVIIGGENTPTLCDGEDTVISELSSLLTLKLNVYDELHNGFMYLEYSVNK